ncbi:MAG TPA: Asp-tRNA(Asn)/Glu-tRNA(Gln) amidotransferase subunit GatB [Candidatus Saccharimonadales bacterium]|nr:Asp-tRNA(Asn)/Glu-tRNA(Gln) amidotransferase subunit GatB [Candidatus Saccharimonadales bacterium]
MKNYIPVIGLEVHVELKTKSKMFCGCKNDWFGKEPNTYTCPVCLGLPGALPVPNRQAIEWCIFIGMALNCEIPLLSKFDRKHYFYPDLAKGYQISQYDMPFAENGYMILDSGKKIRIKRAHMEEDTGKLLHQKIDTQTASLIDFNRSGVPLVEIVTEPDFDSASDVKEYLQKLQQIVRYLDVAHANMEKGEMRLEPNISLRSFPLPEGEGQGEGENFIKLNQLPKYKVEVKNINSFSFVEKAIEFEITRQAEILETGILPKQETRGWNEAKNATVSQRSKEEAMDYRYFPEPDIPPFRWETSFIEKLKKALPELPEAKMKRFIENYKLSAYNAEILTRERATADFFEETVKIGIGHMIEPKAVANVIINKKIDVSSVLPAEVIKQIVEENKIESIDEQELANILQAVINTNEKAVTEFKNGKETVIMFLVGQAMKQLKGKAKADEIKTKLLELL